MAGKNVPATDIKSGDVIDYRGARATVMAVWTSQEDSPLRNMVSPVGIEIAWVDPDNGQANMTRLVWPNVEPVDANLTDHRRLSDDDIKERLTDDLGKRPVKRLKVAK